MGRKRRKVVDQAAMVDVKLVREAVKVASRGDANLAATLSGMAESDPAGLATVVDALTTSLHHGSPAGATTLGHLASYAQRYYGGAVPSVLRNAFSPLTTATSADTEDVRVAAWKALASYAPTAGRSVLDSVIAHDCKSRSYVEVAALISALRACGTDLAGMAVPWIAGMLEHPDQDVQVLSLQTLAWLGPEATSAVDRLIDLATGQSPERLRMEAAKAMVAIDPDAKTLPGLVTKAERRSALIDVLRELGSAGRDLRSALTGKRQRSSGKPAHKRRTIAGELKLMEALLKHHRLYEDEFNPEPATQKELMKATGWGQSKVSRLIKRVFGPEGMKAYKACCVDQSGLRRTLDPGTALGLLEDDPDNPTLEFVDPTELHSRPADDD